MTSGGTSGRFAAFDGIRALAVIFVFLDHAAPELFGGGWLGVELFFALSGYLITSLLLTEFRRNGRIDLHAFYLRRTARLMPALVVVVAFVVLVGLWFGMDRPLAKGVASLTYIMDIYAPATGDGGGALSHTWSLAVEEQFYLVWPVALLACLFYMRRWRVRLAVIAGGAAAFAVGGAVMAAFATPVLAYLAPFPHVPVLLSGAALAVVVVERPRVVAWTTSGLVPLLAAAAALVALFLAPVTSSWLYFGGIAVGFAAVATALVSHLVVAPTGRAARLLAARPLAWLGERSYGFYLWHFPLLVFVREVVPNIAASAVIALAATLACTVVSWSLIEQPVVQAVRRQLRGRDRVILAEVGRH